MIYKILSTNARNSNNDNNLLFKRRTNKQELWQTWHIK